MTFVATDVVVGIARQLDIEARIELGFGRLVLFFGGMYIGLGRLEQRVVGHDLVASAGQTGGHLAANRGRGFQLVGHAADGAEEVGLGIGQVHLLGVEVVLCQGQAGLRLVTVGIAANSPLGAQADLVVDAPVRLQVVFRQGHHLAAH
ncbi:hypothetical protein D9M71_506930 [compost metagenome]